MQVTVAETTLSIETGRVNSVIKQKLERYLAGERVIFDEPVNLSDLTDFQQQVLQEIRGIPYSDTATYTDLARRIGKPRAVRAVASACGENPVPIIIPCHRVVAKEGLGGYKYGKDVKQALLELEGATLQ